MDWKQQLHENMDTYYQATGIGLTILSPEGEVQQRFGEECSYCRLFMEACGKYCPCRDSHLHACREAARLMDGYIFSCPGGYILFAVPIFMNRLLRASILAGPISLEYPDMSLIDSILQRYDLPIAYRTKLYGSYAGAPLVEPKRAHHLCKLLTKLMPVFTSIEDNTMIRQQIARDVQQAKIGEYIHLIKNDEPLVTSQYEQEKQLIVDVLAGNKQHAKALLNEMIGRAYFSSGNNFEIIRTRTIEIITLLSRAIIENGGDESKVYYMTEDSLHRIMEEHNLTDLSYALLEIMNLFIENAFAEHQLPNSLEVQKAIVYINDHYHENISLADVARHVKLNAAYFSTLFKHHMEISFSDYLTDKRISQAKILLKKSNMPIVEVAIAVGFDTQSYFSKVFKTRIGMTPRQFREQM